MHAGVVTMRVGWFGASVFALALGACGGRTLEDDVYGVDGASTTSCAYAGQEYANGSAVHEGACFCFCNDGRVECDPTCSASSGGTTSTGGTSSSGATSNGATSSGGSGNANSGGTTSTGGTSSTAGTSTGGFGAGGSTSSGGGIGTGGVSTGGVSTGGSSTGGSVGTIGSCGPTPQATGVNPLIDNMEDGDAYILANDGRSGVWYTYNDATPGAYQFPTPNAFSMLKFPDATAGIFVANTYGKGFSSWGAGMGFVFNNGCPYDARAYQGLHFFARADYAVDTEIYVMLATVATTPVSNRGTCLEVSSNSCYDDYQTSIRLTTAWQEVYVPYLTLFQQGWGTPVAFDPSTLEGVNFQTYYGGGESFSFSIDAISFY